MPSCSVVSSAGLVMSKFGSLEFVMVVGVGCLKKALVGKYIASVFDFVSPFPTCISRPIALKMELMISSPLTRSARL